MGVSISRTIAIAAGSALLALTAAPALLSPRLNDSFPISTYPMFAGVTGKSKLYVAQGIDGTGRSVSLSPALVANGEPMQAMKTLRLAARSGKPALADLCERIARRVSQTKNFERLERVRIIEAVYDPIAYFEHSDAPESQRTLRTCKVGLVP